MQAIFWIFTLCVLHKGSGLRHHIRHERTRYMSGKNQIYSNDYSPKLNVQDYIPFIHFWEKPLQLLESSMNVPKKLSSRPLFSWDIPAPMSTYTPLKKFTTVFENPVNDASDILTNLPGDVKTSDDIISKKNYLSSSTYMSRSDPLNRAKESALSTTFTTILKKKRKSNNLKKSVGDEYVKHLKEPKTQNNEKIKNETVAGSIRRKKKEKKNRKSKMQRRNKIGKEFNDISSVAVVASEGKKTEMNKPLKNRKNMLFVSDANTTESSKSLCEVMENKCEHRCYVINGTAICLCFKGFIPIGNKCVDINECEYNDGGCNGKCINTFGSRKCICSSGFRLVEGICSDVNECLLRNGHGPCQDKCTNTVGSYYCSCENIPDTDLSPDKHTCENSKKCKAEDTGCSHSCVFISGRAFCMCPDGFELGNDWKTCYDIDECSNKEEYNVKCESDCVNTVGSYICVKNKTILN